MPGWLPSRRSERLILLTSEARIATDRANRYLTQLCRHAGEMGRRSHYRPRAHGGADGPPVVEQTQWSDSRGTIRFKWGQCSVEATEEALVLRSESADEEGLRRIQDGIASRLETIGRRDNLTVTWQRMPLDHAEVSEPVGPAQPDRRRRLLMTIGLVLAGLLVIAVHVGLFGSAIATSSWTKWGVNALVALIVVKLIIVAGHVLLARRAAHRRKRRAGPTTS